MYSPAGVVTLVAVQVCCDQAYQKSQACESMVAPTERYMWQSLLSVSKMAAFQHNPPPHPLVQAMPFVMAPDGALLYNLDNVCCSSAA